MPAAQSKTATKSVKSSTARSQRGGKTGAPSAHADADPRTRAELYEEAKALGIPGRGRMSKADLARAVDEARPSGWMRPVAAVGAVAESVSETVAPIAQKSIEVAKPMAVKSVETAKVLVHDAGEIASDLQERGAQLLQRVLEGGDSTERSEAR